MSRLCSKLISIKKWACPEGTFVNNFVGHEAIINTLSINDEGVMFSGADNGSLTMWDYATGLPFQHMKDVPQPGSLDAEAVCPSFVSANFRVYLYQHSTRREQDLLLEEQTRPSRCIRKCISLLFSLCPFGSGML